jgi:hypothetical protein
MGNQNRIIFIPMRLKDALNERKYYVTYNRGRGQGKGLEKEFDQKSFSSTDKPKVFNSYNDAKKYAEKMEKMFQHSIGGGTAYWVSDEKMNPIKESELKGYLAADVVDDIVKSIGSKFVSGEIKNAPNKNYIYLKLTDIKFGNDVVKMLKSKFGIDSKIDKTFGNIPSVSFASKKVVSESVNEEKVYIDFLNKKKGFKQDRIKFNSYEDAVKWARQNFDKFSPDMIKYESVNEGRELKSIQSDLNKTIVAIQSEISSYKATKGTPQEKKHVDNLKKLHPIKKKLESELETVVSDLYRDAELKIENLISIKEVTIKVGGNGKTINGYDVDYFKTARGVYANIEIPSPNPTFDDDTQIKGFGKDEKEALNDLKKEFEKYLKKKK